MSVLPIVMWPDARLNETCAPVADITDETRQLACDMLDTMYAAPGRGLAGPQVGAMQRIFVMDTGWKDGDAAPMVFINPVLTEFSDSHAVEAEGCLSIPGVMADVSRPDRVRVAWTDGEGNARDQWFDGFAAACVQHEMDHLDGVVTLDHLQPEERARVLQAYKAALA